MRFPLRIKFFVFAALISVAPLVAVSQSLIRIAQDELKSAANQALAEAASQLAERIDGTVRGVWMRPLALVARAVDDPSLDVRQKVEVLNLAAREIPGVAAVQLMVEGAPLPIMAIADTLAAPLAAMGLDPALTLRSPPDAVARIAASGRPFAEPSPALDRWLATVAYPLETTLSGRRLTMSARIDLTLLADMADQHPLGRRGELNVVNAVGAPMLRPGPEGLSARAIVRQASGMIGGAARAAVVQNYARENGARVLGAYALTESFPWAVVAEQTEASAYAVIAQMTRNVALWLAAGLAVATVGALLSAWRLSQPILAIGGAAKRVGQGDFTVRLSRMPRDEIGDLADRVNVMAGQLSERFELMKFVSKETAKAVSSADAGGVRLGGARRAAAMLFSDIRGYTAFAESSDPETVVDMLNQYLETQARIVTSHGGDIDKFIADEVVAVFLGEDRARRAAACAVDIQTAMRDMLELHPDWNLHVGIGLNEGDVVMGAMGASDRMDYTVLGSAVNLAARLCAAAPPDAILASERIAAALEHDGAFAFEPLAPLPLKGIGAAVPVFRLRRSPALSLAT